MKKSSDECNYKKICDGRSYQLLPFVFFVSVSYLQSFKGFYMKKIIFLSTLVLTQTMFATTLTVYNSDLALVKESKEFELNRHDTDFSYDEIPNSIVLDSLNVILPKSVILESQTYRQKTLTQHNIASAFINKSARYKNSLVKILAVNNAQTVVKNSKSEVFTVKTSELIFPTLPTNIFSKPALVFKIKTHKAQKADIGFEYLAKNINFTTDYILDIKGDRANLTAWADIQNNSSKSFKNVNLNLVAGDLNRVKNFNRPKSYRVMSERSNSAVIQQGVQNYHLYKIPFQVDINSHEKIRVKLLTFESIELSNEYTATAFNPLYLMGERTSMVERSARLKPLDSALPTGVVRAYTQHESVPLLLGESKIYNTPKSKPLNLKLGRDFDTRVVQKVISRNDDRYHFNAFIAYTLFNNSNKDKVINLEIPFNKEATSTISSKLKYRFTKGNLATFTLKVKANSQKSFNVNFKSKR